MQYVKITQINNYKEKKINELEKKNTIEKETLTELSEFKSFMIKYNENIYLSNRLVFNIFNFLLFCLDIFSCKI